MTKEENEFENLEADDETPSTEFSEVPDESESLISAGAAGEVYDWSNAPEGVKAPPRIDLNGKTVTINKAEIILPPQSRPWEKSRKGDVEYKSCTFVLHYDIGLQQEFYSGIRVFKRDEDKYSHPTIMKDLSKENINQATRLLKSYAEFKEKDIQEVTLKEFLSFLNSKPKGIIKTKEFENPTNEKVVVKNIVNKFIN